MRVLPRHKTARERPPRRWLRLLGWGVGVSTLGLLCLWHVVHRYEWAGPLVANSLRAVIGVDNVARLEDFVYGLEDRYNRATRGGEKPKARWEVAAVAPSASGQGYSAGSQTSRPVLSPFRPARVGPVHASWSAPGDGEWVAMEDPRWPGIDPPLYKTLLHPDKNRSWAELFVVAIDLRRVVVKPRLGTREPATNVKPEPVLERSGRIPDKDQARALAAFNGGFMTEHGHYGMMLDGKTVVTARDRACTIAMFRDGTLRVADFSHLKDSVRDMVWFRQTPNCMVEDRRLHRVLASGAEKHWGATLDGDTVIRRSAIGLDSTGKVLFVGISNHTSARAIAEGMLHAGAVTVAQLDVNWSYPKFVLFRSPELGAPMQAVALAEGFEFREGEYLRDRSLRDFFYLFLTEGGYSSQSVSTASSTRQ